MMDKMIDPNMAMNAYSKMSNMARATGAEETEGEGEAGGSGGISFGDILKSKASDAIQTMHKSEEMSAKAITGDADITDVVAAVSAAELTLETVVSVRDRMISAYQDIMRMPI